MSATRRNPLPAASRAKLQQPVLRTAKPNLVWRSFTIFLTRHAQAALLSLGQLSKTPFTTLLITVVIGIAMALPGGLFLLLNNLSTLSQTWNSPAPIVLYLKTDTAADTAIALAKQIETQPEIAKVAYISKADGLASFEAQSGLGDMLTALQNNPLPDTLVITPKDDWQTPERMTTLQTTFQQMPGVDIAQMDLQWVKRIEAILLLGKKLTYLITALFCLGVVFIIGSTIHLATQNRREEIFIYQLVGASKRFIRRPFLYTGVWYGLFGSVITWLIINTAFLSLYNPAQKLAQLYGSSFSIHALDLNATLLLLLAGIVSGWMGAWFAVYRYLTDRYLTQYTTVENH